MHAMLPRSEHDEKIVKTTTRLAIDRLKHCIDCNISILRNFLIELQFFNEFQILQLTLNFKFTGAQVLSPMYFKTFVMWAESQLCFFLGNLCQISIFVRCLSLCSWAVANSMPIASRTDTRCEEGKKNRCCTPLKRECYLNKYSYAC